MITKVTDGNSRPAISLPMAGRFPVDFQNCVKQRRDWMRKRILRIAMAVLMLAVMVPSALAATYEEINQDQVFLKQEQRGTCTLASTAMMLRRAALLNRDEIGPRSPRPPAARPSGSYCGLPYNFSYGEMTVSHDTLPGGEANKDILIDLLAEHPEGIMLHAACVPTGSSLTEYKDGQFYCADPSGVCRHHPPSKRPGAPGWENSNAYWYVTSQVGRRPGGGRPGPAPR